ncbi:gamma-glutamylcyclotransferase family protein [uncultured Rhodoblastus sp.]|uniref:gamma-glutamylcyclotransferase family protein n=1 Tax=uncultured Rhodoblastus sp. TaxID=543037 RepID=UPI0025DADC12|nr:gamma-glutamylcyclotransferase family protein [uncultured Rhodoblastus sp.]
MPLTFAYGSNMDAKAMELRCPGAKMRGRARLPRHRVALLPDGFATLVRDAGSTAHGVLWELSFGNLAALDRYEGDGYVKVSQPVLREGLPPMRALIYIGRPAGGSHRAPEDYMARIVAVAREVGLPIGHIDFLRRLAGENLEPCSRFRAIRNPKAL